MKCPNCGAEDQTGQYCASCGAGLDVTCASCGADVPPGAKFCTTCGEPVAGGTEAAEAGGGASSSLATWGIAAVSLIVVVVLVMVFLPDGTRTTAPTTGGGNAPIMGGQGSGGAPVGGSGLSNDMRTNADRLFNRIMIAAQEGNEGEVAQFMPMAIQAYGMVENLDHDGRYHLAMLHLTAESHAEALATAREILDDEPDHILGLATAAEASAGLGDTAQANEYWQRLLDVYNTEAAKPYPEYVDHQPMLPEYRAMAEEATGQ